MASPNEHYFGASSCWLYSDSTAKRFSSYWILVRWSSLPNESLICEEIMSMQKSHPDGEAFKFNAEDKEMNEGMQDQKNARQPVWSLKEISQTMSIESTNSKQSTELHGSNHVSQDFSPSSDKVETSTPIGSAKIVHQSEKTENPADMNEEMDPEIQHLIDTIWEVENCPPPFFWVNNSQGTGHKENKFSFEKIEKALQKLRSFSIFSKSALFDADRWERSKRRLEAMNAKRKR